MGKILCATRGGEAAIETQEAAIRRAIDQNDELIFFYVVDIEFLVHAAYALRSDIVEEEIDKMGEFLLAMAVERAEQQGEQATAIVRHGNFIEELIKTVTEEGITLVVLGRPANDRSRFELEQVKKLARRIVDKTGTEVWIPGIELP